MLDIEKIYMGLNDSTKNPNQIRFFEEKLNKNVTINEQWLTHELVGISSLAWNASNYESANLYESHLQLRCRILNLYNEICSCLNYDFGAKYLTDKLRVCVNVRNALSHKLK